MGMILEEILIYGIAFLMIAMVLWLYLKSQKKQTKISTEKIKIAVEAGLHEPISLHPVIDPNTCINSGACMKACPEEDILGIRNGRATLINASHCVGHGACFHACPAEAISLRIGTEKRGVDLPHVSQNFESNVRGVYIAGELGGMGLIKNSVEQGKQAMENLSKTIDKNHGCDYDVIIVGAGPAGISASLQAKKMGLKAITLEQDSLGGTVYHFPRAKIVMTAPMDLPLHGKMQLVQTTKAELLKIWTSIIAKHNIEIRELTKAEEILMTKECFEIHTNKGDILKASKVLLAIGRRGSPRKLGVEGELSEKVAYRLLEPEQIIDKHILVVGGGDSAIESALLLAENNNVTLSYRSDKFSRLKPLNAERIAKAIADGTIHVELSTNVSKIDNDQITLIQDISQKEIILKNDLVYIFVGGELPTNFLQKIGIEITKRFGYIVKSP